MQKLVDDVNHFWFEFIWDDKLSLLNLAEYLVVNSAMERSPANSHFIDHATKGPQVHALRRYVLIEHLRRNVQRSTDESVGLSCLPIVVFWFPKERITITEVILRSIESLKRILIWVKLLAVTEVRNFKTISLINKDVLRL